MPVCLWEMGLGFCRYKKRGYVPCASADTLRETRSGHSTECCFLSGEAITLMVVPSQQTLTVQRVKLNHIHVPTTQLIFLKPQMSHLICHFKI